MRAIATHKQGSFFIVALVDFVAISLFRILLYRITLYATEMHYTIALPVRPPLRNRKEAPAQPANLSRILRKGVQMFSRFSAKDHYNQNLRPPHKPTLYRGLL